MKIRYHKTSVELTGITCFDPQHIFECGQAFRWHREEDNSYTVVEKQSLVNVKKEGNKILFDHCTKEDFEKVWFSYFDLDTDYEKLQKRWQMDAALKKAVQHGKGIRILRQEHFPTVINFIISANSHIPRIKKNMEILAKEYGNYIDTYRGRAYYSFPIPDTLAKISVEEIRETARVGYRDRYIVQTAQQIRDRFVELEDIALKNNEEGRKILMQLSGVGRKVADCILLFSYHRLDVFPIDVWIHRVMENLYFTKKATQKEILEKAREQFGADGGLAQQYLFYYGREEKLGISKKKANP